MARDELQKSRALFPASFDPVTNGHLDIVQRSLRVFDELVLAVATNVEKTETFTLEERMAMLESATRNSPQVLALKAWFSVSM